jgi:hypothetical protein
MNALEEILTILTEIDQYPATWDVVWQNLLARDPINANAKAEFKRAYEKLRNEGYTLRIDETGQTFSVGPVRKRH